MNRSLWGCESKPRWKRLSSGCYRAKSSHGSGLQSFVLMPQARARHQPRTASYRTNPPAMTKATQIQRPGREMRRPVTIRATPQTARKMRPRRSMFRAKNFAMTNQSHTLAKSQPIVWLLDATERGSVTRSSSVNPGALRASYDVSGSGVLRLAEPRSHRVPFSVLCAKPSIRHRPRSFRATVRCGAVGCTSPAGPSGSGSRS